MSGECIIWRCDIVLDDLCRKLVHVKVVISEEHTVLKAVRVAIHLALAPHILNSENCSPSRTITGCMSPLTPYPSSFGRLKCEKILSPRDFDSAAARSPPVSLEICASFEDCCDLVGSDPGVVFFCDVGGGLDFAAGADDGPACCCCLYKSLAARCRSCNSLRSALVMDFWEGCAVAVATEAGSARTGTGMVVSDGG